MQSVGGVFGQHARSRGFALWHHTNGIVVHPCNASPAEFKVILRYIGKSRLAWAAQTLWFFVFVLCVFFF